MKKTIRDIRNMVVGGIVGIALTASTAVAFAGTENIQALFNRDLKFVVNGESVKSSAPALMANNSTYLQLRDVANMLDYDVKYDGKKKTVTLTDKEDQPATTNSNTSTTTNTTSQSNDLSTNNYAPRQLPITLDRGDGDISVTLNSITQDDEYVYFNFKIDNPTGRKFQIMGENSAINYGLPTKKMVGFGTTGVFYDTTELEHQAKYKKDFFNKDVENVRLNFRVNYYAKDWYVFNVDTKGLFQ